MIGVLLMYTTEMMLITGFSMYYLYMPSTWLFLLGMGFVSYSIVSSIVELLKSARHEAAEPTIYELDNDLDAPPWRITDEEP